MRVFLDIKFVWTTRRGRRPNYGNETERTAVSLYPGCIFIKRFAVYVRMGAHKIIFGEEGGQNNLIRKKKKILICVNHKASSISIQYIFDYFSTFLLFLHK